MCQFPGCEEKILSGRKNCPEHKSSGSNAKVIDRGKMKWNQYTKSELLADLSYTHAQTVIRRDARRVYIRSGKPQSCAVCNYDTFYDVAHIRAVKDYPEDTVIGDLNQIDNLVALCPNHHKEYDAGLIEL